MLPNYAHCQGIFAEVVLGQVGNGHRVGLTYMLDAVALVVVSCCT